MILITCHKLPRWHVITDNELIPIDKPRRTTVLDEKNYHRPLHEWFRMEAVMNRPTHAKFFYEVKIAY
jgi:hypothetical protein